MRIHHLDCASFCPFGRRLFNGDGGLFEGAHLVCHCLLVETDRHGLVLVDTGLGLDDVANPQGRLGGAYTALTRPRCEPAQTAARSVERLGFSRLDVQHIVLTHADLDHAGGLPDFPHARVHVMRAERDALIAPSSFLEKNRYGTVHFAHGPKWATYEAEGEPWFGFGAVRGLQGLPPEILLVPLVGHTRGHAAIAVKNGEGWMLHAGDAYFTRGTIDPTNTEMPALFAFERLVATDYASVRKNHARLRALRAEHHHEVSIFCAHDPTELHAS